MANASQTEITDCGCMFHEGRVAPSLKTDYSTGAWMAPHPEAGEPSRRSICDACVQKIERQADGLWRIYRFDAITKEVYGGPRIPRDQLK